jgi:Tfp pilus assembly protein PilE
MSGEPRSFRRFRRDGFTVVELIFSLTVMIVLTCYAVPHFQKSMERSRVEIASANLQSIWTAERLYWSNNQAFAGSLAVLQSAGFLDPSFISNIASANASFQYELTVSDNGAGFQATAARINSQYWHGSIYIDQSGTPGGAIVGADGSQISPSNLN